MESLLYRYRTIVNKHMLEVQTVQARLLEIYKNDEKKILAIMSNRNLEPSKRSAKMIGIMEHRDHIHDLIEDLTELLK